VLVGTFTGQNTNQKHRQYTTKQNPEKANNAKHSKTKLQYPGLVDFYDTWPVTKPRHKSYMYDLFRLFNNRYVTD